MAVIENDVVMKFKDSSGNVNLLYPITRADNVDGLQEAIRNQSVVTKGTGAVYTATVAGITSLSAGVSFVMIPHIVSTTSSPKLNVNGLGEKLIKRRVSNCTGTFYNASAPSDWLTAGKPITVTYDGEYWVADLPVPNANDIMGAVPIANGGTGATTAAQARTNLGIETTDGTVISGNANYAEVGEWVDGNPDAEDRIGYFVCVDNTTAKMTMRKATEIDDVRGVTITAPAFSGNCSNDKFDSDGNLIAKYSFVAVMGNASVIDNGTCTVNGRCMPTNDGTAIPSPNSMGYQVISRIDATHVLIMVEPQADMLVRIKNDVTQKADLPKTARGTVIALSDASDGPLQGLRIYGRTTQDGTPTPEAPVPLENVGDVTVTVAGKNLLNAELLMYNYALSTEDGTVYQTTSGNYYGTIAYIPVNLKGQLAFGPKISHAFYDANNKFITGNGKSVDVIPENAAYFRLDVHKDYKDTAQVEYGSVATEYEPYKEMQTLPVSTPNGLPGIPVTSGGNYTDADGQQWICDEKDFARGVYVQRIGAIDSYAGEAVSEPYLSTTGALSTGAKVLYVLATPIETPIPEDELAAYAALHTNRPNTTIYNDAGAHMDVGYYTPDATMRQEDIKEYVDASVRKAAPVNLLDNSDFTNLIAQAGYMGKHGSTTYLADRWFVTANAPSYDEATRTIAFSKSGLSIIDQTVGCDIAGKTVTLAAKASGVTGAVSITEHNAQSGHANVSVGEGITTHTFVGGDDTWVRVFSSSGGSVIIDWIALYEGSYTAETLPEYRPKGYMVEALNCGALHVTTTATLSTSWSGSGPYTQSLSVAGILSTDTPHIMPVYSTTNSTAISQKEAWACVSKAETSDGTITFTCFEEKPATEIPIQIEVMR